jgi:hypothetical protein
MRICTSENCSIYTTARITHLIAIISKKHVLRSRVVSFFFFYCYILLQKHKMSDNGILQTLAEENNFVEPWSEAMVHLYVFPGETFICIVAAAVLVPLKVKRIPFWKILLLD